MTDGQIIAALRELGYGPEYRTNIGACYVVVYIPNSNCWERFSLPDFSYLGAFTSANCKEPTMNQTPAQIEFRKELWKEFVSHYQVVLISAPDTFADYCAKFRERWIAGR